MLKRTSHCGRHIACLAVWYPFITSGGSYLCLTFGGSFICITKCAVAKQAVGGSGGRLTGPRAARVAVSPDRGRLGWPSHLVR